MEPIDPTAKANRPPLTHLPLLLNPLLNNLFNNPPRHHSSRFKALVTTLSDHHAQCIVVVPPFLTLLYGLDAVSGKPFHEMCYLEDFLASHILTPAAAAATPVPPPRTTSAAVPLEYTTLNGKTVLLKGERILRMSGFKGATEPVQVLRSELFPNFAGYFPMGVHFQVMHVDVPLEGRVQPLALAYQPQPCVPPSTTRPAPHKSFEDILRRYPLVGKFVGKEYAGLFGKTIPSNAPTVASAVKGFQTVYNQACYIFNQKVPVSLLREVAAVFSDPLGMDLNAVLHDYVETNIYDRVWALLKGLELLVKGSPRTLEDAVTLRPSPLPRTLSFLPGSSGKGLDSFYDSLSSVTLNQVGLPAFTAMEVDAIARHVKLAIESLRGLTWATSSQLKRAVLLETFQILTVIPGPSLQRLVIDADTLIAILHLVVIHARVDHLALHIAYTREFAYRDPTLPLALALGMFNYVLSTLEAVVYHLETDSEHLGHLQACSARNRALWDLIDTGNEAALGAYVRQAGTPAPFSDHPLWSCEVELGESCLVRALSSSFALFHTLFTNSSEVFLLEDLLSDTNHDNTTLVVQAVRGEHNEAVDLLLETLYSSDLSELEMATYLNQRDRYGRHLGHYLFHNITLLQSFPVGRLLDWECKDTNGSTALVTIFRSYDHPAYSLMIEAALELCFEWYASIGRPFAFAAHTDDKGNTLLHMVQENLAGVLRILLAHRVEVDLNQRNHKSLTPLMVYAKYNRQANIETILEDPRVFIKERTRDNWNIFDYIVKTPATEQPITACWFASAVPRVDGRQLAVLNGRYDTSLGEWKILTKGVVGESGRAVWYSRYNQESTFALLMALLRREFTNGFLPPPLEVLPKPRGEPGLLRLPVVFKKLQVDRLIDHLNQWFTLVVFHPALLDHALLWEFVILPTFADLQTLLEARVDETVCNKIDAFRDRVFLPTEINAVEVFFTCSRVELTKYSRYFERLCRVATFTYLKHQDVVWAETMMVPPGLVGIPEVMEWFQTLGGEAGGRESCRPLHQLQEYLLLYKRLVDELVRGFTVALGRINEWWGIHRLLTENNRELIRVESAIHGEMADDASAASALSGTSLYLPGDLPYPDDEPDTVPTAVRVEAHLAKVASPLLLFMKLESKADRYKRLLVTRSALTAQIMASNKRIAYDQETFAKELENLQTVRSRLFQFALREYARESIREQKHRLSCLSQRLKELRQTHKGEAWVK